MGENKCLVEDCLGRVVSKGYCDTHRKRLERHGHLHSSRPTDWGKRTAHPLYENWQRIARYKGITPVEQEWLDDFWKFVAELGEKPSKLHYIWRVIPEQGFVRGNVIWREAVPNDDKALRQRIWRATNPDSVRNTDLKKKYGITLEQYKQLEVEQQSVCAICKKPDDSWASLAVDHCHRTGKVRGLLCHHCNKALGGFKDNVDVLKNAIKYLEEK